MIGSMREDIKISCAWLSKKQNKYEIKGKQNTKINRGEKRNMLAILV